MKLALSIVIALITTEATAKTPKEVVDENTMTIVYLQLEDKEGGFVDSGSGFIVSHDGYVVTVGHLKAEPDQKLWAVIGQREGTRYPLSFREINENADVALWQLPQSAICRQSTILGMKTVNLLDRLVVMGFPGKDGLTPSSVGINNLSSPQNGNYKTDGYLRAGNSGGPAFNEDGHVVAIVQGGTRPGTENNDLIPIAPAIDLIKRRGVRASIDKAKSVPKSCYSTCRVQEHGIDRWASEEPWGPVNSGWLGGGHNQSAECSKLIAGALANNPGAQIELLPETAGKWEESKKDVLGRVEYKYWCKGIMRSGPIYKADQSSSCPLRQ